MPTPSPHGHGASGPSAGTPLTALPRSPPGGASGASSRCIDVEQAIAVLRARTEEEFRISERYDAKGRQLFALAAGFFAASQAVALSALGSGSSPLHAGKEAVLVCALAAFVTLLLVGHRLANAEEPLREQDVPAEELVQWLESGEGEEEVLLRITGALAEVVKGRTANNATRKERYERLQFIARWSLIASGTELLVAIVVLL